MATWKHSTRIDSTCCGDIFIGKFVSLLIKKYQQDKKYMLDTCWQISLRFQMFIIFFEHESHKTSRQLATSYEILVTSTEFLVALATGKA